MNIASAELLQQAFKNANDSFAQSRQLAAENAFRNSQLDLEKRRTAVDQSFRDAQTAHYNAMETSASDRADAAGRTADTAADLEKQRLLLASQPHVQADLSDGDGNTMTFTGTPDQLTAIQAAAKAQGKNIQVSNKKSFAAQFNVGGAQFSFDDQDAADKFADQMKAQHGIDVYAPQAPNVTTTPGGQELVTDGKGHIIKGAPPAPPAKQTIRQVPNPLGGSPLSLTNTTSVLPAMPPAASAPIQPPASHISYLLQNPGAAPDFDAKYGAGSAAKYLSQKPQQPIPGGGGFQISMPPGTSQLPPTDDSAQ